MKKIIKQLEKKINKYKSKIENLENVLNNLKNEQDFKIEKEYTFFCKTESEFEAALIYFCEKYNDYKDDYVVRPNMFFAEKGDGFGYHTDKKPYEHLQEITFEQFKKYVLNK